MGIDKVQEVKLMSAKREKEKGVSCMLQVQIEHSKPNSLMCESLIQGVCRSSKTLEMS